MDVTLILPVYNERENIEPLLKEIEDALEGTLVRNGKKYEVIAVDDGSRDGSTELLRKLAKEKPYLKCVFFRRNAGQTAAFDAGFRHASGRILVTMDSDRQNDPADIPKMIALLDQGYDFVTGWRKKRHDEVIRTIPSRVANWIIRKVTGTRVHDLGCSLKVYRKEITDELRLYGEMHRFIAILAEGVGARVAEFEVNHRARVAGVSKYGFSRTVKVMLDLLTVWFMQGYKTKPIYIFGGVGLTLLAGGALSAFWVLYEKFGLGIFVHKNPLFILSVMFTVIGVQFLGMGLIAEIIIRTYFESQDKTSYSIASRLGFAQDPGKVLELPEAAESRRS